MKGQLIFARRGTQWHGYPLGHLLARGWLSNSRIKAPGLKRQVLCSLLDAAVAHHGACFGIVPTANVPGFLEKVNDSDRWNHPNNVRRQLFGADPDSFLGLSRRHRLEMLSMDGATVVTTSGRILAAGAILEVPPGSEGGGGRTAAAKAIAAHGIGFKVSQDGPVRAWTAEGGETVEQFAIG